MCMKPSLSDGTAVQQSQSSPVRKQDKKKNLSCGGVISFLKMSSEPKDYQASSNSNLSSTTPGAPLNQSLTASSTNEGVSCTKKNVLDTNDRDNILLQTNDQIESQLRLI